ncbi:DUF2207 domain-containing protein [Leptospira ilyithenensis]|uniref:DUF2207 domain-containing protein n=1 Tax=Leptospira ilyithenensis TaxID=2484901 RepID=A0A4R9LMP0_9LEPT|nr:DUF2207 domain-containing protein [Leptospira ilyithenensis]TGN09832.1 DUF2207 domain-containing protein [Leptospira ilyithenensis]
MKYIFRFILIFFFVLPEVSFAEWEDEKTLSWDKVEVNAHLSSNGTLSVEEIQSIRFNGDWRGPYRHYDFKRGQSIDLISVEKLGKDKIWRILDEGDTETKDRYSFSNKKELKIRSREDNDPPFQDEVLTYRIKLEYRNILTKHEEKGAYEINHDFLARDRKDSIRKFQLNLNWDKEWEHPKGRKDFHFESSKPLVPSEFYVYSSEFFFLPEKNGTWTGPGPSYFLENWYNTDEMVFWKRAAIVIVSHVFCFLLFYLLSFTFLRWKSKKLNLSPKDVLSYLRKNSAESIAIQFDLKKVSSVFLGRLVAEGKIQIHQAGGLVEFVLLVSKDSLTKSEKEILDKLFVDSDRTTDVEIKKYYKKKHGYFSLHSEVYSRYSKEANSFESKFFSRWLLFSLILFPLVNFIFYGYPIFLHILVPYAFILFAYMILSFVFSIFDWVPLSNLKLNNQKDYFLKRSLRLPELITGVLLLLITYNLFEIENSFALFLSAFLFMFFFYYIPVASEIDDQWLVFVKKKLKDAIKDYIQNGDLSELSGKDSMDFVALGLYNEILKRHKEKNDASHLLVLSGIGSIEIENEGRKQKRSSRIKTSSVDSGSSASEKSFSGGGGTSAGGGASVSWDTLDGLSEFSAGSRPTSSGSSSSRSGSSSSSSSGGGSMGGW